MKESISTKRNHAFVVRSSDLEKLWKVLEDHIGTVTVSVECLDDVKREFNDLKELLSYDNSPARRIVSLSVESELDDWEKEAQIVFSSSPSRYAISIKIKGPERVDSGVKDKIFDILEGLKPWYFFLAPRASSFDHMASFWAYILIGACVYFGLFFVWVELTKKFVSLDSFSEPNRGLFVVSVLVIPALLMLTLNELRVRIFPLGSFALGQGERRYDTREKVRWGILLGSAGALATSLLSFIW